jgi:hypothetical protein
MLSWTRLRSPRARHSFLSHSTGTGGRPFSVLPNCQSPRQRLGIHRFVRQGEQMTKTVVLKPRPFETSPDADILYSSVTVDGSRRRAIVTHPKTTGRSPAVPLIGGLGCYSLDGEIAKQTGYGPILAALAKNNFVTMRVEKTGEGDSEGPACTDTNATAKLDAKGYVAGLQALKGYAFVDPTRVLNFAHSLGPLLGSMVVTQEAPFLGRFSEKPSKHSSVSLRVALSRSGQDNKSGADFQTERLV